MNVYDFDDTIYQGDSTVDFYRFCLKRNPLAVFRFPVLTGIFFMLGLCKKVVFKERFYRFLACFEDIDIVVNEFWEKHIENIKPWYKKRHRDDDLVISASPEFLLRPVCEILGISNLIASVVDKHTGKYTDENCWGEEKVRRYRLVYGDKNIDEFYSDSLSDTPLALISKKAYVITGEKTQSWDKYKLSHFQKFKKNFLSPRFFMFIVIGIVNTLNCIWISYAVSKLLEPNTAFVTGYIISLIIAYILNSIFNFHEKLGFVRLIKFCTSYIPNFVIQNLIVLIVYNMIGLPEITAYALAGIIGIPITFLCVKCFAFAKNQ